MNFTSSDILRKGKSVKRYPYAIHFRPNHYLYFMDIAALGLIPFALQSLTEVHNSSEFCEKYGIIIIIAMMVYSFFSFANGLYDINGFRQHLKSPFPTFGGPIFTFGILLLLGFIFHVTNDYSRGWGFVWFVIFSIYILISRITLFWYLSKSSQSSVFRRRAVILGAGDNGQTVLDHMLRFDDGDIKIIGFLDDRATRLPEFYRGVPILGATNLIENLVKNEGVELVIIALPWKAHERIEKLLSQLSSWRVDVYLAPDKLGLEYADRPVFRVGGMNILSLQDRPISEWNAVVKRIEDLCLVIPALIFFFPILLVVAVLIKIDSRGGIFFIQDRFGFNNKIIKIYKFRSMYTEMSDSKGTHQTEQNDPRITRVGRFIRRTSIDELPQLVNVLIGSMSVVGPRPHPTGMQADGKLLHEVLVQYASRHRVKPGITGWAQCHGYLGEASTIEKALKRVEYDLYYIENWSVYLDFVTIIKTLILLIKGRGNAF